MTLNRRKPQGYIRIICDEYVYYSTHTLVERLAEELPLSSPPLPKSCAAFLFPQQHQITLHPFNDGK
ncbi:hypothetical protein [Gluconacetobacter diazotrophicus]|uniref:hypothetical protein n=1 Tax=Gluconacetobacter diazotrophicus TaxID=33996 RepID=UPI001C962756|nr:hypothetical protein [Gluconacetobacter diazotrophicus]